MFTSLILIAYRLQFWAARVSPKNSKQLHVAIEEECLLLCMHLREVACSYSFSACLVHVRSYDNYVYSYDNYMPHPLLTYGPLIVLDRNLETKAQGCQLSK